MNRTEFLVTNYFYSKSLSITIFVAIGPQHKANLTDSVKSVQNITQLVQKEAKFVVP